MTDNRASSLEFKQVEINLSKIAFDVANGIYSDIIEIFRLDGMLPPAVMNGPIVNFHDSSYGKLYTIWDRLSNNGFEKQLPLLSHLPLATLRMMGHIKISFYNDATQDYHYINYDDYINKGSINFTTSINQQIHNSGSANALLYHVINSVALLKCDVIYTIHHTKNNNQNFQSWYGMHLPFYDNRRNEFDKGVISLIKKI